MNPIPDPKLAELESLVQRERAAAGAVDTCAIDLRQALLVVYRRARDARDIAFVKYGTDLVAECREYRTRIAELLAWEKSLKVATEREALIEHLQERVAELERLQSHSENDE